LVGLSGQTHAMTVDTGCDRMTEEVLVLTSHTGRVRARVHRISPDDYRVDVERLVEAFDAGNQKRGEFWSVISGLTSYTDSEECAAALAEENLRCGESG
jgi:hypothetical protein